MSWQSNREILSNSYSGCRRLLFQNHHFLCDTSRNHLRRIHIMYFVISKETFVAIRTLVAIFFSWYFHKVKIIKFKGQPATVNPTVNRNVSLNEYLLKNRKHFIWHAIMSLSFEGQTEMTRLLFKSIICC